MQTDKRALGNLETNNSTEYLRL